MNPLEVAEERGWTGLYKKARSGLIIMNFIGSNGPYEPRQAAEIRREAGNSEPEDVVETIVPISVVENSGLNALGEAYHADLPDLCGSPDLHLAAEHHGGTRASATFIKQTAPCRRGTLRANFVVTGMPVVI